MMCAKNETGHFVPESDHQSQSLKSHGESVKIWTNPVWPDTLERHLFLYIVNNDVASEMQLKWIVAIQRGDILTSNNPMIEGYISTTR